MKYYVSIDESGAINGPPHMLPKYITGSNGDPQPTADLVDSELASLGEHIVAEKGKRAFDKWIEAETVTETVFKQNKASRTYSYTWLPHVREVLLARVDAIIEEQRRAFLTLYPGQTMEYDEVIREAEAVLKREQLGVPYDTAEFPYLEADIGVSSDPRDGTVITGLRQAAESALTQRDAAKAGNIALRRARLKTKAAIRRAGTDQVAVDAYNALSTELETTVYARSAVYVTDISPGMVKWNPDLKPLGVL